jgi:hypothetical protein
MFKEQDTSWLQLASVVRCAESLSYKFNGRSFYTRSKEIRSEKWKTYYLSFDDMQEIHNTGYYYAHPYLTVVMPRRGFDKDKLQAYSSSKIVKKSTLQWHKKKKQFIAQNNMVKFA